MNEKNFFSVLRSKNYEICFELIINPNLLRILL